MSVAGNNRAKLLWRCRRGVRELDAILIPYGTERIKDLTQIQLYCLQSMLDQQDPDLLNWFFGYSKPLEPTLLSAVNDVIAFRDTSSSRLRS